MNNEIIKSCTYSGLDRLKNERHESFLQAKGDFVLAERTMQK